MEGNRRASFDLVDSPWLPCIRPDGRRVELGLRATLVEAHELHELFDPSPLVTVALHRLLLAVLHRALKGPVDFAAWTELWRSGRWDANAIGAYLDCWRDRGRFDLFHPERPFYGVPRMDDAKIHPITRLAEEAASGNNATLFDHSRNADPAPISAAEAARRLAARQAFAFSGGVSQPFRFADSPLIRDYTVLAFGETLFETLALNLVPYNWESPIPWSADDDPPAWEQKTPHIPDRNGTPPYGYTDYLTWQSRRVHLVPEGEVPVVRWCQLQQNLKLGADPVDPFKAYVKDTESGLRPRKLRPNQAVWRDSHALFQQVVEDGRRPELFNHLARLNEERLSGMLSARPVYAFGVFGVATVPGRATVQLWRQERLPLPLAYLDSEALTAALGDALSLAERTAQMLRSALWRLAQLLLSSMADLPDGRQPQRQDVSKLAEHLGTDLPFWTRLETAFIQILHDLPDQAPRGTPIFAGEVREDWGATLRRIARDSFEEAVAGLDGTGRTLKAAVRARSLFERELRQRLELQAE